MKLAYERDPYLTELATTVLRRGEESGRHWAVLADTVFYPAGGGQPADHGTIGGQPVLDVVREGAEIRHLTAAPVPDGPVLVRLDWERRFDHMQQHTAQHLVTAIAADRFGWQTTAFHLGEEVSDVELDTPSLDQHQLGALEEAVAAEVRAARSVHVDYLSAEEYAHAEGVRSRGLRDDHTGDVRLVAIAGIDRNTCGGTHVRSTAELEAVKLLGSESMRGGTRVFFVAGGRARRRFAAHELRNAELRALLGAPDAELTTVLAARLEAEKGLERRLRTDEEELAEVTARLLAAEPAAVVDTHFADRGVPFLQLLAQRLRTHAPAKGAFLTATTEGGAVFLLLAPPAATDALPAAGAAVAELLGGRGGGARGVFQGKAASLDKRAEALALVRERLGR
jgi:Ser-tRNA(Ala) deacylase AlaX